ncbi:hypothetical protein PULV_a4164 [Pseudoalteromonas ulvae UL12]|uniref:alpha/beta hydrolase n=1 Tax=Pseudoalteromonas ulvae TaxID=107327 RepID=UPI00186B7A26|nr:alpha/beta hydrolase [Pseudoalteromonas ulvae]MBE0361923.1 hypothetical protein [Pseudoalteromonas ulvae UL12]
MNQLSLFGCLSLILSSMSSVAASDNTTSVNQPHHTLSQTLHDDARQRDIPVTLYFPTGKMCQVSSPCKVAIFGAGYGIPSTDYSFLAQTVNSHNMLMVAITHELPTDPPLSREQPFLTTRMENWQRGADTTLFVRKKLTAQYPEFNFDALTLMGHSNGGDIAALLASQQHSFIETVITYDHRRVPLPRTKNIQILSVRASDYPADDNVLPSKTEQQQFGSCVVTIADARHNDMADHGPKWLTKAMSQLTAGFLNKQSCQTLTRNSLRLEHS